MTHAPVMICHCNASVAQHLSRCLHQAGYSVECCADLQPIRDVFHGNQYALLIADENASWKKDLSVFERLKKTGFPVPLILLSQNPDIQRAVEAVRNGAIDYLAAPFEEELLVAGVSKVLCQTHQTGRPNPYPKYKSKSLITRSASMHHLLSVVERVADSPATVLIQGESGTGKELLARQVHLCSARRSMPFVAMNCAALPENLAESELFGYEKGAFTGAYKGRKGKFELADKGTLLLDEISEMPLQLQAKLLRLLQEKEVDHIGGQRPIPVDVRCIATCNQDLAQLVRAGRFRQDLYYRLRVIPLSIPPLRERKEDIPELVTHFIREYGPRHHKQLPRFDDDAMSQLLSWHWPGNVRELENTVERALLISESATMGKEALLMDQDMLVDESLQPDPFVGMTVKELEKKLIGQTLRHLNHNRTHAAKMLGISIRTLRNKLHEYQEQGEALSQADST